MELETPSIGGNEMANNLNQELKGKHVVLMDKYFNEHREVEKRVVLCTGGFGCSPQTMGNAVYVTFLCDGEKTRAEGYMVKRFATEKEVAAAQKLGDEYEANRVKTITIKVISKDADKVFKALETFLGKRAGHYEMTKDF